MEFTYRVLPPEAGSPEAKYKRSFTDIIPTKLKHTLFEPPLRAMKGLFEENGLSFPADMIDRLVLASSADYQDLIEREFGEDTVPFGIGYCVSDLRLGFLDVEKIDKSASKLDLSVTDALRAVGVHEAAHTPSYTEFWVPPQDQVQRGLYYRYHRYRRLGMKRQNPEEGRATHQQLGLGVLDEGTIDMIKVESLRRSGFPLGRSLYDANLEIVRTIIDKIGFKPLLLATYTEDGPRTLEHSIDSVYGKNGFDTLTTILGKEQDLLIAAAIKGHKINDPHASSRDFLRA